MNGLSNDLISCFQWENKKETVDEWTMCRLFIFLLTRGWLDPFDWVVLFYETNTTNFSHIWRVKKIIMHKAEVKNKIIIIN